jgi:Na+-driven multidrug efflux pump
MGVARLVLLVIVTPLGTNAIASYNINYNLTVFSQIPAIAIMNTMFVAAGMCMGAGRPEELQKLYRNVAWLNRAVYLLVNGTILLLRGPILAAFHPEPEMIPELVRCLVLVMTMEVLIHTESFTVVYLLRGCGDVGVTTLVSVLSVFVMRLGASWVFSHILGMGVFGVFLGMCCDWVVRAVAFELRYLRGKWKHIHVIPT